METDQLTVIWSSLSDIYDKVFPRDKSTTHGSARCLAASDMRTLHLAIRAHAQGHRAARNAMWQAIKELKGFNKEILGFYAEPDVLETVRSLIEQFETELSREKKPVR